ncbi:Protein of unknown function [Bacillus toyonensis]|nr:Protein of unknown function [Bacillus toyonensis]
MLVGGRPY